MKDLWYYSNALEPTAYCDDTSYRLAVDFLDLPGCVLEDWGCGTTYARKFVKHATYRGVDGSNSRFCERHVDLREYRESDADCILIRHVLEHNREWPRILDHAVATFRKRMCLAFHMSLAPYSTVHASTTDVCDLHAAGIPNLNVGRAELWERLRGLWTREEIVRSATPYGFETIIYVSRDLAV